MPGKFKFPPDHKPGMVVPPGGSSCAKCKFYDRDGSTPNGRCSSKYFSAWRISEGVPKEEADQIPAPPTEYCSDWFDWEGSDGVE